MIAEPAQNLSSFLLPKHAGTVIYFRPSVDQKTAAGPRVSAEKNDAADPYYSDADIAALLGISVGRLRNKICAGDPLPPRLQADGFRKRLWPRQAFHQWLEQFEEENVRRKRHRFLRRS